MSSVTSTQDLAPGLERCFLFDAVEDSCEITGITGHVPEWLRGSYYVNGPARFERAGQRYRHWLDGDGMVCALHFTENGVRFTSRFVQTPKLREEEAAARFLYRGFGTAFAGDRLRRGLMLEPPVNVSVYRWAGRLLAFGEQSLPYELDPENLATRGEFDFHGRLNEVSPFAAHPKFDPATGHMFNFGISFSATQPALNLYEFDAAANLLQRSRFPITMPHSNHDFGISSRHVVFFLSPLVMDFNRFWGEKLSVMESLRWEPERGSSILVAPRISKSEPPFAVPAGAGYCLHLINCFEEGNTLTMDILELEAPVYGEYQPIPDLFATVSPGRPVRYRIALDRKKIIEKIVMDYDRTPDFPSIDPALASASYDDFWMLGISESGRQGRKFFNQLARGSWSKCGVPDLFQAQPGEYLAGEPVYASRPHTPGEGVVILEHINTNTDQAAFLLFDAAQVAHGPIARLPLRHRIHPGFHASFFHS
ncbi:MAG: carotenoid oxygenase family protein [Acidobacteria bacterium]|nr:carotenoid oxygenase family protein [Acidobacteriota bacterium]